MHNAVGLIHNLSSNSQDLESLVDKLHAIQETLLTNLDQIDDALMMVPANEYTLGYLILLSVKCIATFDPFIFIDQVTHFIKIASASQLKYAPQKFEMVCQKLTTTCVEIGQPMRAILPLKKALFKIGSSKQITPQHYMVLKCCIISKCYKSALSLLDSDSFIIDTKGTGISGRDVRLYYYYGGFIYAALKKFTKAQEFFIRVLSFPAIVPSAIMVEAYKKYVLISLILDGTVGSVSQYSSNAFSRQVKQICPAYSQLMTSFETNSVTDVQQCVNNNLEAFKSDGNFGLVKQVVASLGRRNVAGLTKTYLTLSLNSISEKTGNTPHDVEKKFLSMIEKSEIFADVDQQGGMIIFKEDPNLYNTKDTMTLLDQNISYTIDLNNFVSALDEQITLSPEYVNKMVQSKRGKWGPSGIDDTRFEGVGSDFRG